MGSVDGISSSICLSVADTVTLDTVSYTGRVFHHRHRAPPLLGTGYFVADTLTFETTFYTGQVVRHSHRVLYVLGEDYFVPDTVTLDTVPF